MWIVPGIIPKPVVSPEVKLCWFCMKSIWTLWLQNTISQQKAHYNTPLTKCLLQENTCQTQFSREKVECCFSLRKEHTHCCVFTVFILMRWKVSERRARNVHSSTQVHVRNIQLQLVLLNTQWQMFLFTSKNVLQIINRAGMWWHTASTTTKRQSESTICFTDSYVREYIHL